MQHVDEVPVPAAAVLSTAALAGLPPLPSLNDAAALCLQSFLEAAARKPSLFGRLVVWQSQE